MGFGDTVEGVKANLLRTGYPERRMHFIVGDVLETIPATQPSRISLLRLDTDWYQSTLHELEHLYDLLVPHGVLIIDDYGWCRGSRKAADEFFARQPFKPMMHRVDQGPRLIIKPHHCKGAGEAPGGSTGIARPAASASARSRMAKSKPALNSWCLHTNKRACRNLSKKFGNRRCAALFQVASDNLIAGGNWSTEKSQTRHIIAAAAFAAPSGKASYGPGKSDDAEVSLPA